MIAIADDFRSVPVLVIGDPPPGSCVSGKGSSRPGMGIVVMVIDIAFNRFFDGYIF